VACTLLFVPAAVGIFSNYLRNESRWAAFPTERYLTFRLTMDNEGRPGDAVPDDREINERRARAFEELAARVRQEPGVTAVTFADRLPGTAPDWVALEMAEGSEAPSRVHGNFEGGFAMMGVGPGYHEALGLAAVAGRTLHSADAAQTHQPVLVNEAFVRAVGRHPVGARVRTVQRGDDRTPGPWHEIVGVVTDWGMDPTDTGETAYLYRAASAADLDPVVVVVRVEGNAAPLAPRLGALATQIDPGLQLKDIATLTAVVTQQQVPMLVGSAVFGSVLLGAVVFSAASLYALMAVAVARRTREIGIRVAVGANARHVLGSLFARAARQLGGGIIAGNVLILLFAWRADSLTTDLLAASVITSFIMAVIGALACAVPARRALHIQPTEALRHN
jgi:putative ABC transport system permease protein